MAGIGGDSPLLIGGFARQCVTKESIPHSFAPEALRNLKEFEAHRSTMVDVACKETESEMYSGDHRERQSVELKFGDFLDYFVALFRGEEHWLSSVTGLQFYLCQIPVAVFNPDETCEEPVLPKIMELFEIPSAIASERLSQVNVWMTTQPSRTGIHYDAYRNVLVVLHGQKTVKLYPPSEASNLYARPIYSKSSNHSSVNFVNPNLSAHPRFKEVKPITLTAMAGDAIYIPEGWWHQVDTDAFTVAINYWFDGIRSQLVNNLAMGTYYSRVVMGELVKAEAKVMLRELKRTRQNAAGGHADTFSISSIVAEDISQLKREDFLLAVPDEEQSAVHVKLANDYPNIWKIILSESSDELAAFLTDYWDRTADEAGCVASLFAAVGDQGDTIKQNLLNKQENFMRKAFERVVATTFGYQPASQTI